MKRFLSLILLLNLCIVLQAQQEQPMPERDKNYRYEFADGSTRIGIFLEDKGEWYLIDDLVLGPTEVRKSALTSFKEVELEAEGRFPNPHYSRQLFGPTAIPQAKGEFYWNNLLLEANTLQYGISSKLSVGIGTGLFSTLAGMPVFMLTGKYAHRFQTNHHVAIGYFHVFSFLDDEGDADQLSISFAAYTRGSKEKNFSVGLGLLGFTESKFVQNKEIKEFRFDRYPAFYFATNNRVSRNWLIQSETYLFRHEYESYHAVLNQDITKSETGLFLLVSARYIKPAHSWDFAVAYGHIEGEGFPFPLFGYTQKF